MNTGVEIEDDGFVEAHRAETGVVVGAGVGCSFGEGIIGTSVEVSIGGLV